MAVPPAEQVGQVRTALKQILTEYGPQALSRPSMMSNLLKDLLPDAPSIGRLLVAAAEDQVAEGLRDHVAQGLDGALAVRLAASSFAAATMFTPDSCAWVVSELAVVLGLMSEDAVPRAIELTDALEAQPGHGGNGPFQPETVTAADAPAHLRRPARPVAGTEPAPQGEAIDPGRGQQSPQARLVRGRPARLAAITGLPSLARIAFSPDCRRSPWPRRHTDAQWMTMKK